jgi:hypothetical protein
MRVYTLFNSGISMQYSRIIGFSLIFLASLSGSCRKDKPLHTDFGYGYFPAQQGLFVIYDVDSTVFDAFRKDTVYYKYQLKEYRESVFNDNEGRPSLRVERYVRNFSASHPYDSIPWRLKNVWYETVTPSHAERMEENQRFVRMIFPVKNLAIWNGNAQNTLGDWEYQYQGINQPADLGARHFDSTATIIEKDETNLLNRRLYKEVYAKNAGLIYRQVLDVYDTKIDTSPVVNRIKGGVYYTAIVHSWGKQ